MISELVIRNIALISELSISFESGFNVLSGETGAGKSIIVDSVNLILGSRADKELIRAGEQTASVEAQIELSEEQQNLPVLEKYGFQGKELIVSRELSINGKNVCRMNGHLVNLTVLREIMSHFVDIYGQNQNINLLDETYHLQLIDAYAGSELEEVKQRAAEAYRVYQQANHELQILQKNASEKTRLIDLLSYQIQEIERASLKAEEDIALSAERRVMQNAEHIAENLEAAKNALVGERGAVSTLYEAIRSLQQIASLDPSYERVEKILSDAYYAVEDASYEEAEMAGNVIYDGERLNEIETRLVEISVLKRKYGASVAEILEFCAHSKEQLEQLQDSEVQLDKLQRKADLAREKMEAIFEELTSIRKKFAVKLEERLKQELSELGMRDAKLHTEFTRENYSAEGWDAAALLISVNKGTPPRRLAKIASGGEISRVMLAIKNIVAENESIDTMIFDEIDTGISGTMAQIVARKIANIAKKRQVICVTHLPQIAAMGDANFFIEKKETNGMVTTDLYRIDQQALEGEIARLSGGLQSDTARRHAQELLANAALIKQQL